MADIHFVSGNCECDLKYIYIAISLSKYNEVSPRLKALSEYNYLIAFLFGGIVDEFFEEKIINILKLLE